MQCPVCGATESKNGKPIKTQGQLNLHMYHHHRDVPGQNVKTQSGQGTQKKESCAHEWRLLNPHKDDERAAMQANYGEVCTKCLELR